MDGCPSCHGHRAHVPGCPLGFTASPAQAQRVRARQRALRTLSRRRWRWDFGKFFLGVIEIAIGALLVMGVGYVLQSEHYGHGLGYWSSWVIFIVIDCGASLVQGRLKRS